MSAVGQISGAGADAGGAAAAGDAPLWSPAQGPACLLRASAGTGKTYQLVNAYVELVAAGVQPTEIVAVTFTRRAASELRGRIHAALARRGADAAQLADLQRAPLTNFHGLALQLLHGMGLAAGYTEATTVLGEGGADAALFVRACHGAWFADADLCGAAEAAARRGAVAALAPRFDLDAALPQAMWEALARAREDGVAVDAAALVGEYDAATARATADAALRALRATLLHDGAALTGAAAAKLQQFAACAPPAAAVPLPAWAAAWRAAFAALDRRGHLGRIYSAAALAAQAEHINVATGAAAAATAAPHVTLLLDRAWAAYTDAKRRLHAVDFADIIVDTVRALTEQPALLMALRRRIRAVLVDEAQDTNRLQRRLVQLLVGIDDSPVGSVGSVASGVVGATADWGATADTPAGAGGHVPPAHLVVVGDAKQSIYTFRGADAESFARFGADVARCGGTAATLAVSRRSCAALVRGINHLGEQLFGAAYEPLLARPEPAPVPGGMALWPVAAGRGAAAVAAEATAVATCVHAALAAGRRPGEVALLMPTMPAAPLYVAALQARGIPAVLGGGGGLEAQPEITEVLALCTWLLDGAARLQAAVALRSPIFGLTDDTWLALLQRPVGATAAQDLLAQWRRGVEPAHAAIEPADRAVLAAWAARLPALVAVLRAGSARAGLAALEATLDLGALYLAQENGAQRLANLQQLATMAAGHDAQHGTGLPGFVAAMAARRARGVSAPLPPLAGGGGHAVTVCSMHQSKGLQWPLILLAGLTRRGRTDAAPLVYAREQGIVVRPRDALGGRSARFAAAAAATAATAAGEQRRLMYVAVTRAEREVVFVMPEPAALGRVGMAAVLAPWARTALADGVLARATPPDAALPPWQQATPQPQVRLLSPVAPPGTHVEITVTELMSHGGDVGHDETIRTALDSAEGGDVERDESVDTAMVPAEAGDTGRDETVQTAAAPADDAHAWIYDATAPRPRLRAAPATAAAAADPADPADLAARERGIMAHAVLAALDRLPAYPDVDAFIAASLSAAGCDLQAPSAMAVAADVAAFLASPLGAAIAALPAAARRHELPFSLTLDAAPYVATLRGQMDLLHAGAAVPTIVDFKYARRSAHAVGPYRTQLMAYALAATELCGVQPPIAAYVYFLRERGARAVMALQVGPDDLLALRRAIATLAVRRAHLARAAPVAA